MSLPGSAKCGKKDFGDLIAQSAAQAVYLVHQMQYDIHPLVVHSKIRGHVPDQVRTCDLDLGEGGPARGLIRDQPFLFDPELQRLDRNA